MLKLAMILILLTASCVSVQPAAICDGLRAPVDDLNRALIADGGPQSKTAGARVIGKYDAGCGE